MISLTRLYEFALAYRKYHIYLWLVGIGTILFSLANLNPFLLVILSFIGIILFIVQQAQVGWTHDKIHNLLIYKQITKQPFTLLEQALIDKYFGNQQRKELIIEENTKCKIIRTIYGIDIATIVLFIIGIMIFIHS